MKKFTKIAAMLALVSASAMTHSAYAGGTVTGHGSGPSIGHAISNAQQNASVQCRAGLGALLGRDLSSEYHGTWFNASLTYACNNVANGG